MLFLDRTERDGFPTAAGELPVVGHLPILYRDAIGLLRRSSRALGPLFWVNFGFAHRRLFYVGADALDVLRAPAVVMDYTTNLKAIVGSSAAAHDGALHRHMRSAITTSFSPQSFLKGASAAIASVISARVDAWFQRESIAVHPAMRELSLEIILRVCGVPTEDLPAWSGAYRELMLGVYPIPGRLPGLPAYRSRRARAWIDDRLRRLLALAREGAGAGGPLIEALSQARDEEGKPLSDQEIVDNTRAMLFAGHETTASILAWIVIFLSSRDELRNAVSEEHTAAPDAPVSTSFRDAQRFPVTGAIYREVLRLYAPGWFIFRTVTDAIMLHGRRIPRGTPLAISPTCLGYEPSLFPDPDRFDPSRWKDRSGSPGPLDLAPFGAGPHFCVGYNLAHIEALQLQSAFVRALRRTGLVPRLQGPSPKQVYFPLGHPTPSTRVAFHPR
ncbi:cytochrome P450 [Sorangium sp. So ce1389]|uniref:cytochrome P450 n=1 Tax=Sorangium sp. So ce1389 TaxID=3133336 RepID=UPI003F610952